jgi:competence protein ComEC
MSGLKTYEFPFARYPGVRNALLLMLGVIIARETHFAPDFLLLIIFCILFWALLIYERRAVSLWMVQVLNLVSLVIMVLVGISVWNQHITLTDSVRTVYDGFSGSNIGLSGVILSVDVSPNGMRSVEMQTDTLFLSDGYFWESRVQVRGDSSRARGIETLRMGDRARVRVDFRDFPQKRNPGGFDVAEWLESKGIQGTGFLTDVVNRKPDSDRWRWVWWRARVHEKIERLVSTEYQPILKAILLGDKSGLENDTKTEFSRAGLSHVMAVSGMHVGFILMPIWLIIPIFWSSKTGRPLGLLVIVGILLGYAGLTGFSSSVSRASITAALLAFGKLFQQNRDSVNTTGVAALIIVVYNPGSMFQIGFQLSFCAVLVILVLAPVLADALPKDIRFSWKGTFIQFIGISTMVQFGLFPILATTFGEFSVAGPIANMIGVPLTQLLFLWSMFALPISFLTNSFDGWIMVPAEWVGQGLLVVAGFVGQQEWAWIEVHSLPRMLTGIWVMLIGLMGSVLVPELRWKWLGLVLGMMFVSGVSEVVRTGRGHELEVRVLDVGQGDATIIRCPSGKTVLVDAGVWSPGYDSGKSVILPELKALGINKIDAVILSHPHGDHVGGMLSLIENIEVGRIYQSDFEYGSGLFRGYMLAAERVGTQVVTVERGDVVRECAEAPFLVMHPGSGDYGEDPNAWSVVVRLVYGETSFLFTGDAEEVAESELVARFGVGLKSDWLKAGHHGSKTSSTDEFLNRVAAEHVVVSLAYKNRYKHPHQIATHRLITWSPKIKYTSLEQGLVYVSDGKQIRLRKW